MDGKSSSGQIAQVSTTSGPLGATLIEPICACLANREIGMIMLLTNNQVFLYVHFSLFGRSIL